MFRDFDDDNLPNLIKHSVIAAGVVATMTIAGLSYWLASQADRLAATDARRLVESAIDGWEDRTLTSVYDYSFWDDAFEVLRDGTEREAFATLGEGTYNSDTFDLMFYFDRRVN